MAEDESYRKIYFPVKFHRVYFFFFLNLFPEYLFEKSLLQRLCFTNLVKVNFLL